MNLLLSLILIISLFIILFAYIGFPLFLYLLSKIILTTAIRQTDSSPPLPSLQVIISCYNEAPQIKARIEDILAQGYPADRLSILVISDGSTDQTVPYVREIQAQSAAVHLFALPKNVGKNQALNAALAAGEFRGDLLCFTDADSLFAPGALLSAARFFADPRVGLVGGKISYWLGEGAVQQTEGFFWRLENFLRDLEGKLGVLVSCSGLFIMMRRELCRPLPNDVNTDFAMPLMVLAQGYQSRFDKNAVARSLFPLEQEQVLKRRKRTIIRAMTTIATYKQSLPWHVRQVVFWHKTARFLAFPLQFLSLLANILLLAVSSAGIWPVFLALQLGFYGAAMVGWLNDRLDLHLPYVYLPYQFTLQSAVAFQAVLAYRRGQRVTTWTPPR